MFMDSLAAAKAAFLEDFSKRLTEEEPSEGWKASGRKTKALPNGEDNQFWVTKGPELIEGYAKWRDKNPQFQVWDAPGGKPAVELGFNIVVPGTDTLLRGYVDRVFIDNTTGQLMIVDLKSGARKQDSQMQLEFYRVGLRHALGVDIPFGAYYNARDGQLDHIVRLDKFSEDTIFRWVRNMLASIEQNLLIPNVGMQCSWCGVKEFCPTQNDAMVDFDPSLDLFKQEK